MEGSDGDLIETAIREAREETLIYNNLHKENFLKDKNPRAYLQQTVGRYKIEYFALVDYPDCKAYLKELAKVSKEDDRSKKETSGIALIALENIPTTDTPTATDFVLYESCVYDSVKNPTKVDVISGGKLAYFPWTGHMKKRVKDALGLNPQATKQPNHSSKNKKEKKNDQKPIKNEKPINIFDVLPDENE